jgi:hypothetical protein
MPLSESLSPAAASASPRSASTEDAAWDEAFLRVESYLHAHQLKSRVQLNRISSEVIAEARSRSGPLPGVAPVTLAMQVVQERVGAWFTRVFQQGAWSDDRFRARGRLAQILAGTPLHWPNTFLSEDTPPPELIAALVAGELHAGPEVRFSNMPPAHLDLPSEDEGLQWRPYNPWRFVRAAASWMIILGVFGVAWAASH